MDIKNLIVSIGSKKILHGVSLTIQSGQVHALMGPNGSGKSTLAGALSGDPSYTIDPRSVIRISKKNLVGSLPEIRAREGLFLAFQSPVPIAGVSVVNLLRSAYQALHPEKTNQTGKTAQKKRFRAGDVGTMKIGDFRLLVRQHAKSLNLDESFLNRSIHDGFSGGERKKIEMLQALVLEPRFAVFDEIDTGLDVDALKSVAKAIQLLRKKNVGVIIITHYHRILQYVIPDVVHVLVSGRIVKTAKATLARDIERHGYTRYEAASTHIQQV